MTKITLDLRTKIVRTDAKVWRIFPGKNYVLLDDFKNNSRVYLDMPGLELPSGKITSDTEFLIERMRRALANMAYHADLREWRKNEKAHTPPQQPQSDLSSYTSDKSKGTGNTERNLVLSMFHHAQKDDIILVPDFSKTRMVHIGEFATDAGNNKNIEIETPNGKGLTPTRSVKWLATVDEWRIDKSLSSSLRHQVAISEFGTDFMLRILDIAYGTYVYGNDTKAARIFCSSQEFSEQANFDFGLLLKLSAQLGFDFKENGITQQSFEKYFTDILPDDGSLSLSSNLNSPGFLNVKGVTLGPLLLVALLSLGADVNMKNVKSPADITVVNSLAPPEHHLTAQMQLIVANSMIISGSKQLDDLETRTERFVSEAGAQVTPHIVPEK